METPFSIRYLEFFNRVCAFLGDGWRVDRRDLENGHRILISNPAYQYFSITVRMTKGRFHIFGSVPKYTGCDWSSCTAAPNRQPWEIAEDIRRKILVNARRQIQLYMAEKTERQKKIDSREILIHSLSKLVRATRYSDYNRSGLCSLEAPNGIYGGVKESNHGYSLELSRLSTDQLIKVIGFISTL